MALLPRRLTGKLDETGLAVTTPATVTVLTGADEDSCLWGEVETLVLGLGASEDVDPEALREPEGATEEGTECSSGCWVWGCSGGAATDLGVFPVAPTDGETLRRSAGLFAKMADSGGSEGTSGMGLGDAESVGRGSPSAGRSVAMAVGGPA